MRYRKHFLFGIINLFWVALGFAQSIVSEKSSPGSFNIAAAAIYVDANDIPLVKKSAKLLQTDIQAVTGTLPNLINTLPNSANTLIIIGSLEQSPIIQSLITNKKIDVQAIRNQWEAYTIQSVANPFKGVSNALVIVGSDRRGTAYGVLELSKQLGVSPWYWWADVPVKKKTNLYVDPNSSITDAPKVKYRGVFINDEAPALSNWSREKFGGFNHKFYSKVFELMLRLKANYLWPAMWGNAFYDDDAQNIKAADEYGIVIGTSHHEPLMRAHDEWKRYGKGKWNYDSNAVALQAFWRKGMQRATNEKIVSIGMRGDGDEPMTKETATALLERIVKDQRDIIATVTGKPATETPQLWALYKEVQDYYDKGMRVPDDVTLLLCDDNWGNIRKLPKLDEAPRKGGYGIYYHFDYVGGPRNYKWVNTNPLPRVWEQMHMAWEYNARQIWIVNVGDIKPMELPISFFLDYAWNPEKIGPTDIQPYTEQWCEAQFGPQHAKVIANIMALYAQYNGRRKPELLDANTYSLYNYNEWAYVVKDYNKLLQQAEAINNQLPANQKDAYFQLVLHPVRACANLNEMYYYTALNKEAYTNQSETANQYADKVKALYQKDSLITLQYHRLGNGKWNHMMSQTHIGYTNWQQPSANKMPAIQYISPNEIEQTVAMDSSVRKAKGLVPENTKTTVFYEWNDYVSIDATHYSKAVNNDGIQWTILPGHGRTGEAITHFPVTAPAQKPGGNAPCLSYDFYTYSTGDFTLHTYCSPTLNYHNTPEGLQYAVSVDGEVPQIISLNKDDNGSGRGIWNTWVADNIIIKQSQHHISSPGKHTVTYWPIHAGVVLQKLVLAFGGLQPSYLGPSETRYK